MGTVAPNKEKVTLKLQLNEPAVGSTKLGTTQRMFGSLCAGMSYSL